MKISINQFFTTPGYSYPFTGIFVYWVECSVNQRIQPSEAFIKIYGKDYGICFSVDAKPNIAKPEVHGPILYRRGKEVRLTILLPHPGGPESQKPAENVGAMKLYFDGIAIALRKIGIDPTRVLDDMPGLISDFKSRQKMIRVDDLELPASFLEQSPTIQTPSGKSKKQNKLAMPTWKIPKNIQKRVDDDDGMWEDERFDPILLTVMTGVEYEGRDIPLSWQIEFDPFDDRLEAANEKLESSGIEPDGDGWAEVVEKEFAKRYPKLADELHSDSESSTCVLWVESEKTCQKLIQLVWSLIHSK